MLDALGRSGVPAADVGAFIHGTTVVINALTERRGVATALVTTSGFRDVLEIGRANRPDLYNLSYAKPVPFVPRHLRFEVTERMSYRGEVLEPLSEDGLDKIAAARRPRCAGGRGVPAARLGEPRARAACGHRARQAAARRLGIGSHRSARQWREYERSSTAVLSAYVQPVVWSRI